MTSGNDPHSLILTEGSSREAVASAGQNSWERLKRYAEEEKQKRKAEEDAAAARRADYIRAHLPELVKASQLRALRSHPDLSVPNSVLNQKFVAAYRELQAKNDPMLEDPNWPEILAGDTPPSLSLPNFAPQIPATTATLGGLPETRTWRTPRPPYPTQARMSHLTGTTTVRVTTDASGSVSSVQILKSAGSAILDSSTQGFVKMNWKGPPNSTRDTSFDYRLQDSGGQ